MRTHAIKHRHTTKAYAPADVTQANAGLCILARDQCTSYTTLEIICSTCAYRCIKLTWDVARAHVV